MLEYWANRKRRLDHCQQFVLFERSARQTLDWLRTAGEAHLSRSGVSGFAVVNTKEETEGMLRDHMNFRISAKVLFSFFPTFSCLKTTCGSQNVRVHLTPFYGEFLLTMLI